MKIRNYVELNKEEMFSTLASFIEIESVIAEARPSQPFGEEIDRALDFVLDRCKSIGMHTYKDPDGYYGYAEIGSGEELIGVLTHVDIVTSGSVDLWSHPPFKGIRDSGKIYGRGAIDDKGPIVSILYAIKCLLECEVPIQKRLRFIFGTDEESHWRGIKKYLQKEEHPVFSFTPDSSFPLIFAEKGLLQLHIKDDGTHLNEPTMQGGSSLNAIPETAVYYGAHALNLEKVLKKLGFDFEREDEEIIVIGKSAHSATPQFGINAISRLAIAMKEIGIKSKTVDFISERIGFTQNGSLIFGNCYDNVSGYMSLSITKLDVSKNHISMGMDIRIPVTLSCKYVYEAMLRICEKYGFICDVVEWMEPIYTSTNHPYIHDMLDVYVEETGLDATPIATGGATYARALPHCVAFGAVFPGQSKMGHRTDEFIEEQALVKMTQIYAKALEKLLE